MPPKKSEKENVGLRTLRRQLQENRLGNLYFLHGEESYLREYYLGELKKRLLPQGLEAFNQHTLAGKELSSKTIAEAVDCLPVMSERTLVLVVDYDLFKAQAEERDALSKLLNELPDYVCLVFYYDLVSYKPDARTKLAQAIKALGLEVSFPRQSTEDLADWIHRRFQAMDREIDSELARYLIFLCGDLMNDLTSEIAKIGAYAGQRRITRTDVDAVAIPRLDARVFQMTDAITAGDFDKAARVLGDLLDQQEAPIMILAVLGKQLRQLHTARLALDAGEDSRFLAQLWRLHPYPADKLMAAAAKFDLGWCRWAVARAAETDLEMKSTGADPAELLTGFLAELAHGPVGQLEMI